MSYYWVILLFELVLSCNCLGFAGILSHHLQLFYTSAFPILVIRFFFFCHVKEMSIFLFYSVLQWVLNFFKKLFQHSLTQSYNCLTLTNMVNYINGFTNIKPFMCFWYEIGFCFLIFFLHQYSCLGFSVYAIFISFKYEC